MLDPQNIGFWVLALKKQCVDLLKIRVWSLISSEGAARLPVMMMSCLGYYCNETGLGLSRYVFYKTFGPRVWPGGDPLPVPSV